VITASLYSRFRSRGNGEFADKVLAALRNQFGGHAVHAAANKAAAAKASPASKPSPRKAAAKGSKTATKRSKAAATGRKAAAKGRKRARAAGGR
jgi:hypothetical protein